MTDNTEHSSTLPLPLRLVREHKISLQMIGRACGVSDVTVHKVMDPQRYKGVSVGKVQDIRAKVEEALGLFGHTFEPGELWKEYDGQREAA